MDPAATRILLVEDDPAQARLLREILSEPDGPPLEITHALQLSEAERAAAADRYHLILLDLSLPDSQGLDTLRRMRSVAVRLPIVVLTNLDDEAQGLLKKVLLDDAAHANVQMKVQMNVGPAAINALPPASQPQP